MKTFFLPLLLGGAALLSSCSKQSADSATANASLFKITVQLDWVAEPEHGSFYTAEALGYFKEEGLDVTLLQGGPNAYALNKVAINQAQLGQSDSTNVLIATQAGAPLLNVGAIFQHDPTVFMMQTTHPAKDWKDLEGQTVMARPEYAFLPFVQKKYGVKFSVVPQNFDLARLASDPTFIQQGFYIAEPYYVKQKGVDLKFLYVWDTGFDAYTTLFTNRNFARDHGDKLRAFLRALYRGYKYYIEVDGQPAHDRMLAINPKVTPDFLAWSRQQIIDAKLARNDQGDYLQISPQRYQRAIDQLVEVGALPANSLTVNQVMDASFLPVQK